MSVRQTKKALGVIRENFDQLRSKLAAEVRTFENTQRRTSFILDGTASSVQMDMNDTLKKSMLALENAQEALTRADMVIDEYLATTL